MEIIDSVNSLRENMKNRNIKSEDYSKRNLIMIDEKDFKEQFKNEKKIRKKISPYKSSKNVLIQKDINISSAPYKSSKNVLIQMDINISLEKIKDINISLEKIRNSSKEVTKNLDQKCVNIQNLDLKRIRNQGNIIPNNNTKKQNKTSKNVFKEMLFENCPVNIDENELSNTLIEGKHQMLKKTRSIPNVKGENAKNVFENKLILQKELKISNISRSGHDFNFGKQLIKDIYDGIKSKMNVYSIPLEEIQSKRRRTEITKITTKNLSNSKISERKDSIISLKENSKIVIENEFHNSRLDSSENKQLKNILNIEQSIKQLDFCDKISEDRADFSPKSEPIVISSSQRIFLVFHNSISKTVWDFSIFIVIMYTAIVTPIYLCFYENCNFFRLIESCIEFVFIIDFILNFLTTYHDEEENIITTSCLIVEKYIFSWCLYDLIVLCPFELISKFYPYYYNIIINQNTYVIRFTLFKWLKMFRLAKIFNSETSWNFIHQVIPQHNFKLNRVFKLVFFFLLLTHISACFFVFLGYTSLNTSNWISQAGLLEKDYIEVYIASLYFMLATIFTIGYGDITPVNIFEKLCMIIFMLIGSMMYSYAISSLSNLFSEKNTNYIAFKRKLSILDSIEQENGLQIALYNKLKTTISIEFKKNQNEKYIFLESLPSKIRNDLTIVMYQSTIKHHKFLKNKPNDFIYFVLPLLKFQRVLKGDVMISVGEIIDEMYIVLNGNLSLNLGSKYDYLEIYLIKKMNYFGDLLIQSNVASPYELKCKSKFSDILFMKKSDFLKVKISFIEKILEIFKESLNEMEIIDRRRKLFIELFNYFRSSKVVLMKISQLNMFIFRKGFIDYFKNNLEFEDMNDFIMKYDIEQIIYLLNDLDNQFFSKRKALVNDEDTDHYKTKDNSRKKIIMKKNNIQDENELKEFNSKCNKTLLSDPNRVFDEKMANIVLKKKQSLLPSPKRKKTKKIFNEFYKKLASKIYPHRKTLKREIQCNNRITKIFKLGKNNNFIKSLRDHCKFCQNTNKDLNGEKDKKKRYEAFNQILKIEKTVDIHVLKSIKIDFNQKISSNENFLVCSKITSENFNIQSNLSLPLNLLSEKKVSFTNLNFVEKKETKEKFIEKVKQKYHFKKLDEQINSYSLNKNNITPKFLNKNNDSSFNNTYSSKDINKKLDNILVLLQNCDYFRINEK